MSTTPRLRIGPNPAYAGKAPRPLKAACHDGTPFLSVECRCGYGLHLHESQLAPIPPDAELATRCHACGELLLLMVGDVRAAFQQMRDEGWVA